jgi:hypothetical protein
MKAKALVPALALTAALLASPSAEADSRYRSERGGRPPAHRYEGDRGSSGSRGYGYRPGYGYRNNHGSYGRGYRSGRSYYGYGYRPDSRGPRYYAPPPAYYGYGYDGYGYGGYDGYGYGYYPPPPPPPRYYRPRGGVSIWFGF